LFGTPLVFERSPGQLPGDAGLRVARQFDECVGLTRVFAKVVDGPRATGLTERSLSGRARARVVGILAGCQDRDGRGYRLDS
jgi:hypothetical protein